MSTRHRRDDVVAHAVDLLDADGLGELSMRRLAAAMGVQAGALYHHFTSKQALLEAVAGELLRRGRRATEVVTWEAELRLVCVELRDVMLAHRDAAALLREVYDAGGAREPERRMRDALLRGGADDQLARVGASTLLRFVFAHVADDADDFAVGLGLVLDGLTARMAR